MHFDRTGIILYTVKYTECVHFYEHVLELPKMFESKDLTCFAFGNAYLMVEVDDQFDGALPTTERIRTCLRINVSNVRKMVERLQKKGVDVDYQEHSWGTVAKFFDPDGNLCAFKDSERFEEQVLNG